MNPYENENLQDLPDALMRPGGFVLTKRLLELADIPRGSRILDIGCGTGGSVRFLLRSGFDACGADTSEALIARGNTLYDAAKLVVSDAGRLPFEDSFFDATMFECSLSLMEVSAALREAHRVLKMDGWLMVSDVFSGREGVSSAGLTLRTLAEFSEVLNSHGFEVMHTEDKTSDFESFVAQVIMSTGSLEVLFNCGEWTEIKKARPRYCLAAARKV